MRLLTYSLIFACLVGAFSSCGEEEVIVSGVEDPKNQSESWDVPSYVAIGEDMGYLRPERFLGRGFDVTHYTYKDYDGFRRGEVLDVASGAWSPFGRVVEYEDLSPNVEPCINLGRQTKYHQSIARPIGSEVMSFSDGSTYYTKGFNYTHRDITMQEATSRTCASFISCPTKSVMYDLVDPTRLEFYLHKDFVRDLGRLQASKLIELYGTHLVTSYTTGAFMSLVLSAKASLFTELEMAKMESNLWVDKAMLSRELKDKVERNISNISIVYRQGGSDYMPDKDFLGLGGFYQDTSMPTLSEEQWYAQIRPNDNSFVALPEDGQGLVPIADLISDVPLKVKYVAGILERIKGNPSSAINYVLCNPQSLRPFTLDGKILRVSLGSYADAVERIALGLDHTAMLSEGVLLSTEQKNHSWDFEIGENALWTISSRLSKKYLCTDGVLRTIHEDTKGLRYWLLNPIVPTAGGNTRKLSQLFIQPKV